MATDDHNNLPSCWQQVKLALEAGLDKIILFGPPGVGKTFAGLNYGDVSGGAFRLICTEEMTSADITGHYMPSAAGSWHWHEGAAVKAWEGNGITGGRLVVDEIDRASGDVLSLLLSMLDSEASASWLHPERGVELKPLAGFSAVMTTNIEDMRELPTALKDRFPVALRINTPHPDALTFLSEDLRVPAALSADLPGSRRVSLRGWAAFDKLRSHLLKSMTSDEALEEAAKLLFPDNWSALVDSIRVNNITKS
jgi:MoxR-like ATPase